MTRHHQGCELLCEEVREALSGVIDGDPRSHEDEAVARHLEHCTACTVFRMEIESLDRTLREHLHQTVDADSIWTRVTGAIADEPVPGGAVGPEAARPQGRRHFLRLGAAAALVIAVAAGGLLWSRATNRRQSFLAGVNADFRDFVRSGGVLDLHEGRPRVVRRWMERKVAFELPAGVSGPEGAQLAGARLCSVLGRKLVFLAYRSGSRDVGLYVAPASGLGFSESDRYSVTSRDDGLTTAMWQHHGLGYVVVSNAHSSELQPFITHFRR